jgi:8-oxo-dGTP pyrophosphatase MutT (NUDIX family)
VHPSLATLLDCYQPEGTVETADILRVRALTEAADDPWRRDLPLHVTASALIVHPATARVLLRWHQRQQAWLQVGGHGDPGESDPLAIARREAGEETGLADLVPWPDAEIRHVVIVGVPAGSGEPAHEHADIRYFMATEAPEAVRAEDENAPLRWLSLAAAHDATAEANLRETLARMERLLPLVQAVRERDPGRDAEHSVSWPGMRRLADRPDGPALIRQCLPEPARAVPAQVQLGLAVRAEHGPDGRSAPVTRLVHLCLPVTSRFGARAS